MNNRDEVNAAIQSRDIDALWVALAQMSKRDGAPLLAQVLLEDWHDAHEDIVFELGLIGDPRTTDAVAKAAIMAFQHLVEWGNLHAFQRKCAYALARIGNEESRIALQALARHSDPHLREYGEEGLKHWPLPYRTGPYA